MYNNFITQKRLKKFLDYEPETGIFRWKIRKASKVVVGVPAGCPDREGYNRITIDGHPYRASRLAFLYMLGYFPENEVDHIDRVVDNDRWSNLREVSRQCNVRNRCIQKNNRSGVTGVVYVKKSCKWKAGIGVNKKHYVIGIFDTFLEAVCHRLAAEQCLGWYHCDSNSPAFKYVKKNIQWPVKK